jgi:DNA-binding SARP family transcriptional activator/tetratricopeptide (TPR) repeat protein
MRFRILGPIELVGPSGHPIDLKGAKTRALLGLLLLNPGRVVSSDEMIDRLWAGTSPHDALGTLQVHISRLRKALQDSQAGIELVSKKPGYQAELDREELDVTVFERLLAEGRAAMAGGDPETASRKLDEAQSLWRGSVLADVALSGPAIAEITRLEEARVRAVELWVETELACGRHKEMVSRLEGLVAEHPLQEQLWGSRMLALYRAGRQGDALRAYQDLRGLLSEELGIDPSPAIRTLHEAILRQETSLDWVPPAAGARIADPTVAERVDLPPEFLACEPADFVGRDPEMEWLHSIWGRVLSGHCEIALVSGEAGIGKTRLAANFGQQLHAAGAVVLLGRCDEDAIVPYQPFVEAIRRSILASATGDLRARLGDRRASELARLIPELRERIPDLPEPPRGEAETQRYRLFDAIASFLYELSAKAPLLVVVDDLHWADRSTLLLLRHLVRQGERARILVLACYRETEASSGNALADLLADLRRERIGERLRVEGFSFPEVAALCRHYARDEQDLPTPVFVEALRRETQGNPFFIDEVLRHFAAAVPSGERPWASAARVEEIDLPESVREVVGRRLLRLSRDARDLLSVASAIGLEFDVDLVEQLMDMSSDRILDALEEAVEAGVLVDQQTRYAFSHALIRRTLYDGLSGIRRVRLHRKIGLALQEVHAGNIEPHLSELAHHFYEAAPGGSWSEAAEFSERAGAAAMNQLAYDEAAHQFRMALEVLSETGEGDLHRRCGLLLAMGDAQWRAGDVLPARDTFFEASSIARDLNDAELLASAALGYGTGLGGYARSIKSDVTLIGLLEEALDELDTADGVLRVRLLARLAIELYFTLQVERRRQLSTEAVDMARRIGDQPSLLVALHAREWSTLGVDVPLKDQIYAAEEILELAEAQGEKEVAYQAAFLRVMALISAGDLEAADEAVATAERIVGELRMPVFLPWIVSYRAMRANLAGRFKEATDLALRAVEQANAQHSDPEITLALLGGQIISFQLYQAGFEHIIPMIQIAVQELPQHPLVRCSLAMLAAEYGNEEVAREAFEPLAETKFETIQRDANWLMAMWTLAQAAAALGDEARAEILYEMLEPFSDRWVTATVSICFGPVGTGLGALATTLKRYDEAERYLSEALRTADEWGMPFVRALVERHYAAMLIARNAAGDRKRAREMIDNVVRFGEENNYLGMSSIAARLRAQMSKRTR